MGKHAYLILAHENSKVLQACVQMIDDQQNDIFIHVDKKSKDFDSIQADLFKVVKASNIKYVHRHKVYWGTNSIVKAEIELLKQASKNKYEYYHIISGADLPIKSQKEIHEFFDENKGKEFIHFGTEQYQKDIASRYDQFHFFTKQLGRTRDKQFWCDLETYSLAIQRRLKINRSKKRKIQIYGGANWCSITHEFVEYLLYEYRKYSKYFWFSQVSDELVYQTVIMNSRFKEKLYIKGFLNDYNACVRLIDWNRGNPYVWTAEDYQELIQSECMFARKFSQESELPRMLMDYVKK